MTYFFLYSKLTYESSACCSRQLNRFQCCIPTQIFEFIAFRYLCIGTQEQVPMSATTNHEIQASRYLGLGTQAQVPRSATNNPGIQGQFYRNQVRTPQLQALFGKSNSNFKSKKYIHCKYNSNYGSAFLILSDYLRSTPSINRDID